MASNGVLIAAAYPAALDLMLKPLVASSEFTALPHKNWAALSKTVPGTTAKQVCTFLSTNTFLYIIWTVYIASMI